MKKNSNQRGERFVIALLFFLSGFSGLIYQVLWMRKFKDVVGSSLISTSIVIAAFMIGLLVGSYVSGLLLKSERKFNELKLYAYAELLIGLYALLFVPIVHFSGAAYGWIHDVSANSFVLKNSLNGLLSLLLLVIPTSAMGATLPLLVNHFSKDKINFRSTVSLFYAINTFGGALAGLIAGFVLIKKFGITGSIQCAAVINVVVGLMAFLIARRATVVQHHAESSTESEPTKPTKSRLTQILLGTSLITGFTAIGYEVLWIRCLNYLINNSTYTFALILFVFLTSIAIGSAANNFIKRLPNKQFFLGITQLLLAVFAMVSIWIFYDFASSNTFSSLFLDQQGNSTGWYDSVGLNLYLAIIVFLIPSVLMGLAFPVVADLYYENQLKGTGVAISRVFVFNTLGSILGALIPVFIFIPILGGIRPAIIAVAALNVLIGVYYVLRSAKYRFVWAFSGVLSFLLLLMLVGNSSELYSLEKLNEESSSDETLFYKEGTMATVKVYLKEGKYKSMSIDGVTIASETFRAKEKLIAHLPFMTNKKLDNALVVGLASGTTASSLAKHKELKEIDIVEIVPTVLDACKLFDPTNELLQRKDFVNVQIDDIISFLTYNEKKYDLISSDGKFGPLNRANTTMLSEDYYRLCKNSLSENGIMIQWVSAELPKQHLKTILNSTRGVFDFTALFMNRKNMFVLSSNSAFSIDSAAVYAQFNNEAVAQDLYQTGLYTPNELRSTFTGSLSALPDGNLTNSFDRPILEYDYHKYKQQDEEQFITSYIANLGFVYDEVMMQNDVSSFDQIAGGGSVNYKSNKAFLLSRILYVNAHLDLGNGNIQSAVEMFDKVVGLDHPNNVNDIAVSAKVVADYHLSRQSYKEAIRYATVAMEKIPSFPQVYTLRGVAHVKRKDTVNAILDFKKALELNPADQAAIEYLNILE